MSSVNNNHLIGMATQFRSLIQRALEILSMSNVPGDCSPSADLSVVLYCVNGA